MIEPLSITAGVVGLVMAAAQTSFVLARYTKRVIAAPQQAKTILSEVNDIGVILSQLQSFFLGFKLPDRSRVSLLEVEVVVTIISRCVFTFSELEKMLDEFRTGDY